MNYLLFSQLWFPTVQDVLQADWQDVWHSPHPPLTIEFFKERVFKDLICFIRRPPLSNITHRYYIIDIPVLKRLFMMNYHIQASLPSYRSPCKEALKTWSERCVPVLSLPVLQPPPYVSQNKTDQHIIPIDTVGVLFLRPSEFDGRKSNLRENLFCF